MDFDALFSGLDRHTLDGITRGSIYALVALGYTMVYGVMKLINFAHSEVFMVGTWTVLGVYTVLGATTGMGVGVVIGATVAGTARRDARLGRHRTGRRTDRLPAAAQEGRSAADLPDHRHRLLARARRDSSARC